MARQWCVPSSGVWSRGRGATSALRPQSSGPGAKARIRAFVYTPADSPRLDAGVEFSDGSRWRKP